MPEVRITPQPVVEGGLAAVYTGTLLTTNTYRVRNDGKTILHFLKTAAVACTVTIDTPNTVDGHAIAQATVTVAATTGNQFCGPFPKSVYNDSQGDLTFTCSDVDGLTVAALEI